MQENHPSEAPLRQGCCLQKGARTAGDSRWRHYDSEMEEQKRMHMVIELVCLEHKILHSAKHAVPLPRPSSLYMGTAHPHRDHQTDHPPFTVSGI